MSLRRSIRVLGLVLLLMAPWPAAAQTCSVSASPIAFGTYNPQAATPNDSSGNISVTCQAFLSLLLPYEIRLSAGNSGNFGARHMSAAGATLQYNLYSNVSRSTVWGNGSGGFSSVSGSILLSALNIPATVNRTVYGRVPALQSVPPGSYGDFITVTVLY